MSNAKRKTKVRKKGGKYVFRSAKTGRFVTEKYALKHPKTTVKERIK